MHQRKLRFNVLNDEGAQALTEFAIVIPVVLLCFLALLQYLVVVRTTQLVNYAAYAAARAYAVHAAVDGPGVAKEMAGKAAAYALAPVARLVPREVFGFGGSVIGLLPDFPGKQIAEIMEGYVIARQRLNPNLLGGSVQFSDGELPRQVHVEINYPQPIFIPGLAELWNLLPGKKIYYALKDLRQGLEGMPTLVKDYELYQETQHEYEQWVARVRRFFPVFNPPPMPDIPSGLIRVFPYVNVRGQCSMGYVDWGKDPDYRPRLPADGSSSGSPKPPDLGPGGDIDAMANKAQEASKLAQEKAKAYQEAKSEYEKATLDVNNAQREYDTAVTQSEKDAARTKLEDARRRQSAALAEVNRTKEDYDKAAADARAAENNLRTLWPKPSP